MRGVRMLRRVEIIDDGAFLPRCPVGRRSKEIDEWYEARVEKFCATILAVRKTLDFQVSSRGWCYILESHGLGKSEFDACQKLINACRKNGRLPLDICAEDEGRATFGLQELDYSDPKDEANRAFHILRDWHSNYAPFSFWEDQEYYVEMATEKVDLRSLFAPVCGHFYMPIFNASGWSDINSRAALMQRFKKWEARGKKCVLLYCGDFDPGGLHISNFLRSNLADLSGAVGWSPDNLIIDRFGLDYDFIEAQGLTWIDNLETSKGKVPLDSPSHPDHLKPYVQDYLHAYCERDASGRWHGRKVEANALVVRPDAGRALCREAILRYVSEDAVADYEAKVEEARETLRREIASRLR
jgi:hypothetical protein